MKRNRVRLTESQLHKVIKESVKKVLREDGEGYEHYEDIPVSWKEHDDGIATYNRSGLNIGDYKFKAPYNGDSEDSINRRKESRLARQFANNGRNSNSMASRTAWEEMINDPVNSAHDFVHDDDDATFVRGSRFALVDDDMWDGVNEPKRQARDKSMERALSSANKSPLHRRGSLNREL